jgi:hypothetical protein
MSRVKVRTSGMRRWRVALRAKQADAHAVPIQLTSGIHRMRPDGGAGLVTTDCGSILSLATEFIFNNELWC